MNALPFLSPQCLFIEIGQSSLRVLNGDRGLETPLERLENSRLSPACKERLSSALQQFLNQKAWRLRQRAFCGVTVRGVSLRQLTLPVASKEELQRLLALQLEREFPLAPEELAWGACPLSDHSGTPGQGQQWVVAAVRREVLQEYTDILAPCGITPIFTLAALARNSACLAPPPTYALLDIGRDQSELTSFETGTITGARILPWGGENVTRSIAAALGLSREEAERLKIRLGQEAASTGDVGQKIQACVQAEAEALAGLINHQPVGWKLYLSGATTRVSAFLPALAKALGPVAECERLEFPSGPGCSAATIGLRRLFERNGAAARLVFQITEAKRSDSLPQPVPWSWAALACLLLAGSLTLRYAEPFLFRGRLSKRLVEISNYRAGVPRIDRELGFLQYLETNQPPFLDALLAIAKAAPGGTRFDSLSMTRRGEVSMKGMMANAQQATDLRAKLIDSGVFATVVLDEQTPTPDRQKVLVRLTAQWKPNGQRPPVSAEPLPKDDNKPGLGPGTGMPNFPPEDMVMPTESAPPMGLPGPPLNIQVPPGDMPSPMPGGRVRIPSRVPVGALPPPGVEPMPGTLTPPPTAPPSQP